MVGSVYGWRAVGDDRGCAEFVFSADSMYCLRLVYLVFCRFMWR